MPAQKDNPPRKPGRPRGSAPGADNRQRLLDVALTLFASQGVTRTSLNAIARAAGVTPAMLNYYFNSREHLLDVIISERFLPLRNQIAALFAAYPEDPLQALTQMVSLLAELAQRHAWFAPLWMQETIGEMPALRVHLQTRFGEDQHQAALTTIVRWQREGKLNPALAPELLFTTLLSLVLAPFSRMRNDRRLAALTPEIIVRHALAVIDAGIGA